MKLIQAVKRTVVIAGAAVLLKDLFDWFHGDPQHLKYSRSRALQDLLRDQGYTATHRFPAKQASLPVVVVKGRKKG